jgi:SH3-like domain-containing protein
MAASLAERIRVRSSQAIVIARQTEARFEPSETATAHFSLSEGARVEVVARSGDWVKAVRFDGKAGWIQAGAVEKIKRSAARGSTR